MRLRMGLVVLAVTALTSCGDDGASSEPVTADPTTSTAPTSAPASSESAGHERLPTGKDGMEVAAGTYLTPDGFAPELLLASPTAGRRCTGPPTPSTSGCPTPNGTPRSWPSCS